ncbi:hypothetical protein DB345_20810 [Spartobacteria bacterium LR76]|nr:hypothetical protein DB345_20810 [Spartobacteria bacterium LR76]
MHTILTHPGGAHKDEFLACCVLVALTQAPIIRREPAVDELADPGIAVVDVGHEHTPGLNNFDHHQFPADHPPVCSLSLVLEHLGLREDARVFCDWLEAAEWFDSRGPHETAKWLGVSRETLDRLISPVDITLLRRFAQGERFEASDAIWQVMRMVGEDLLEYVHSLRERLDFIGDHAEVWEISVDGAQMLRVLYLPRTTSGADEPSFGLDRYIQARGLDIAALVYPDRRGTGYGLSRHNDHRGFDFTRLSGHELVHFAHARGFVAKTSATTVSDLKRLLVLARAVPESLA